MYDLLELDEIQLFENLRVKKLIKSKYWEKLNKICRREILSNAYYW